MRRLTLVALVVFAGCHKSSLPKGKLDPSQLYPLIVRDGEVPPGGGLVKPLGVEGLEVALVTNLGATPKNPGLLLGVSRADLATADLDEAKGWQVALHNLEAAVRRDEVHGQVLTNATGGEKLVVFHGDWRAASCLLLPGLRDVAAQQLGAVEVLALIPHRNALVLLGDRGPKENAALEAFVLEKEKSSAAPLTSRPLHLEHVGRRHFDQARIATFVSP